MQSAKCKVQFLSALFFSVSSWDAGPPHSLSSRGLTTGSRLWDLSQRDPYRIHWIATVALLPRDDKKCITLTLSCHCEPSQMAWQSSQLYCRAATHIFYSIQHLLAQISLITWIPWSSHGMTMWRKTRPRMTKRIQDSKNPHMIIFSLQDMWQTNKINTKHVPNPNHRLD